MPVALIGAPVGSGAGLGGAEAGPRALRAAGIRGAIAAAGCSVVDLGDLARPEGLDAGHAHQRLKALPEVAGWAAAIRAATRDTPCDQIPVFLGGDHSLSLGTLPGLAERAAKRGRPFYVLWIDAHPDCHTLETTESGHLHGTPVAHALGATGFAPSFETVTQALPVANLLLVGIRSVDEAEARFIKSRDIAVRTSADVQKEGPEATIDAFLAEIRRVGGVLHVSLDADALDPSLAPGVSTPVADGLTIDHVRRMLAAVSAAGVLGSMDLVEVNPFLDRDERTARMMVELAATALRSCSSIRSSTGSAG